MKKAWEWLKAHITVVLGALSAILLGFLAWGAYNKRVGKLKDSIKVEKAMRDVAVLETKRDTAIAREAALADQDARLEARDGELDVAITEAKRAAVAAAEAVEGRTDAEVVDRFNELYPR